MMNNISIQEWAMDTITNQNLRDRILFQQNHNNDGGGSNVLSLWYFRHCQHWCPRCEAGVRVIDKHYDGSVHCTRCKSHVIPLPFSLPLSQHGGNNGDSGGLLLLLLKKFPDFVRFQ
jgi:hypothetical protein